MLVVVTCLGSAELARAFSSADAVVAGLRVNNLYVDAAVAVPSQDRAQIQSAVDASATPVFLVILPAGDPVTLQDVHAALGQPGVYAILTGSHFTAAATAGVLPTGRADQLAGKAAAQPSRTAGLVWFIRQVDTESGDTTAARQGSSPVNFIVIAVLVPWAALVSAFLLLLWRVRRARHRLRHQTRADMQALRATVEEDITRFGEQLEQLVFAPRAANATDEMRTVYGSALDQYDKAKKLAAAAQHPRHIEAVTAALEDGRYALAVLAALREGRPRPPRRAPCFFDPGHGPSTEDIEWAPVRGGPRIVPACQADAVRVRRGQEPNARRVHTPQGSQAFWDAGSAYWPWAAGYYGGLGAAWPEILVGTALGAALSEATAPATSLGGGDFTSAGGDFGTIGRDFSGAGGDFSSGGAGGGDFGGTW